MNLQLLPVIMAGGVGQRLWPISTPERPKQFISVGQAGHLSALQETILRCAQISQTAPLVVSSLGSMSLVRKQVQQVTQAKHCNIILEPQNKNTLAVATISALEAVSKNISHILLLPSDHKIGNLAEFSKSVQLALDATLTTDKIITFGIKPAAAHTGYGYIKVGQGTGVLDIVSFAEKPGPEKAKQYVDSGNFLWNSGVFLCKATVMLEEVKNLQPELYKSSMLAHQNSKTKDGCKILDQAHFDQIKPISIDRGLMEKTNKGAVVFCQNIDWSDTGSPFGVYEAHKKDKDANVLLGNNIATSRSAGLLVINQSSAVVDVNNLENISILLSDKALVVSEIRTSAPAWQICHSVPQDTKAISISKFVASPATGASQDPKITRYRLTEGQELPGKHKAMPTMPEQKGNLASSGGKNESLIFIEIKCS